MAAITNPADVLDRAADEIETRGLHQGSFFEVAGSRDYGLSGCRVCALGAIGWVVTGYPTLDVAEIGGTGTRPVLEALVQAIQPGTQIPPSDMTDEEELHHLIATWSDAPGRTTADVAATMRAAARGLRGQS